jgi:hypothetical protein
MPEPDIGRELRDAPRDPMLPIENKLIRWSLGIGLNTSGYARRDQSLRADKHSAIDCNDRLDGNSDARRLMNSKSEFPPTPDFRDEAPVKRRSCRAAPFGPDSACRGTTCGVTTILGGRQSCLDSSCPRSATAEPP